ncbi:MAG: type II toxin-antitoxin system PemK/MazF family toxin [Bacteroidales bacterium]
MKQGEIWITDLNPVMGSEQEGIRPVVIISGNARFRSNHFPDQDYLPYLSDP